MTFATNLNGFSDSLETFNEILPKCSMYEIFTYIWLKSMVHVGTYSMHGACGLVFQIPW